MAGAGPVLTGALCMGVSVGAPVLIYYATGRWLPAMVDRIAERRKVRRAQQRPEGPSIETAVANLRRLRRQVQAADERNHVRHVALLQAYDTTLIRVCGYVDVEAPLAVATGSERPFARLVTESALEDAGIDLDPPR